MVKAINGNVILKKIEEEESTYGQIIIPDLGREKPELGLVIDTSETYNWHIGNYVPSNLKVGDKVVIPKMGSMTISQDGEDYILIKETEILAIIENN
jgi:chaperonin GroES